ncbi:unnamed protein product [Fraxinus pennsylvanica]|uniref:Uncharacterized protein n=1 Tax=Fraxinus pennsylvanica TaxID=56036 RepID=A0AAD1YY20_9LAMI|nr:unnamed protein product [Fraxinus pennsylvanica]
MAAVRSFITDLNRVGKVVKLAAFSPLDSAREALRNLMLNRSRQNGKPFAFSALSNLLLQKRVIKASKPVAGTCSRCSHGATVADMKTMTRFCYIPFYWKSWKAIMCSFCGAILKSYR